MIGRNQKAKMVRARTCDKLDVGKGHILNPILTRFGMRDRIQSLFIYFVFWTDRLNNFGTAESTFSFSPWKGFWLM